MTPPLHALPATLAAATKKHVAPLFRVDPWRFVSDGSHAELSAGRGQGTMTFVTYRDRCFGLTNEHALEDGRAYALALETHTPLPGRLVYRSDRGDLECPFDVALFELDEDCIRRGGKIPLPVPEHPPVDTLERTCLAVGYPSALRRADPAAPHSVHGLYHIVLPSAGSNARTIMLAGRVPDVPGGVACGGISGGAIMLLHSEADYELLGIVHEGNASGTTDAPGNEVDLSVRGTLIHSNTMAYMLNGHCAAPLRQR